MPFIERTQVNLPLVFNPEIGRSTVEYSEYSRAVESSQAVFDDSDAVVIEFNRAPDLARAPVSPNFANQETDLFLDNFSREGAINSYGLGSSAAPLESYSMASRLHRFPVYGSLIIDVYI